MKTSNRRHTVLILLHLIGVLLPTMAMAQQQLLTHEGIEEELEKRKRQETPDTAYGRGTQTSPDPWTVSSSSALFSRPTFDEAFKLSADVSDGEHGYSLSGSVGSVLNQPNRFLDGLQTVLAYSAESQMASVGIKWNLSLKDIRFLSEEKRQEVYSAGTSDFKTCMGDDSDVRPKLTTTEHEQKLRGCGEQQRKAQDETLTDILVKRRSPLLPTFSAGMSAAYGFENERWGRIAGHVAMDLPFTEKLSLVVNGAFESSPGEEGVRQPNVGGSLALSYILPKLDGRVRLEVAGKFLGCLDNCGEESSTLQFGPLLGIAFGDDKDSLLGVSLNWSGKGESAGDAFLGLSLTRSFGPL